MRLVLASLSAAGATLLPMNPHLKYQQNAILLYASSDINASMRVDGTFSDLGANMPVSLSRSGTTVTVTFSTPHTLGNTRDFIKITGSGIASLDGFYAVASVTSPTVVTYTSGTSATTVVTAVANPVRVAEGSGSVIGSTVLSASSAVVPTVTAANAFYTLPYTGLILQSTAYTAGTAYLGVRQTGLT